MGYDVAFWKQSGKIALTPREACDALSKGESITGVETLPLADIFQDLKAVYPGIYKEKKPKEITFG